MHERSYPIPEEWQKLSGKILDIYSEVSQSTYELVKAVHPEKYIDIIPIVLVAGFLGFMALKDRNLSAQVLPPTINHDISDNFSSTNDGTTEVVLYSRDEAVDYDSTSYFSSDTLVPKSEYTYLFKDETSERF